MKIISLTLALVAALGGVAAAAVVPSGAWSRPAITTGVVYLTLRNTGSAPTRLVKAASPVAQAVELHESMESKAPMGSMSGMSSGSMSMGGVASMHPVAFVPIPAHGSVKFAPGGYHIMLIGLRHPLHAGQTFPVRLYFAHAPPQRVTVQVRSM